MATHEPIIGVFTNTVVADRAINDLKDAGVSEAEISYWKHAARGGFFDNLKNLFTREVSSRGDVAKDLVQMGVSEDAANYYTSEYQAGRPVVAVKTSSHIQDALVIMRSNGGYSYKAPTSATASSQETSPSPVSEPVPDQNPPSSATSETESDQKPQSPTTT